MARRKIVDWDFLVVGGGSAGAVLAARLSEDPDARVLLLEAGPDYRSAQTPTQFLDRNLGRGLALSPPREELDPEFFWSGITARRTGRQDVFPYRRGRGLGGSSTINGLCAIRGVPADYADWVAAGAVGWGYDDLLPAFRALETDAQFPHSPWHGDSGPIPIYREPESGWGGTDRALRDAALHAGHPWDPDHNSPDGTGAAIFAMNIRDGRRVSTNDAYLEPARDRANLTILGGTHVDRVLFEGPRAVGVRSAEGREFRVAPGGEVILSAGAIHSPAILLRSGIGPEAALHDLGVGARGILPVGEGHQDHAVLFVELPVTPESQQAVGNRPTNVVVRYSSGLAGAHENDMLLMYVLSIAVGAHLIEMTLLGGILFVLVPEIFKQFKVPLEWANIAFAVLGIQALTTNSNLGNDLRRLLARRRRRARGSSDLDPVLGQLPPLGGEPAPVGEPVLEVRGLGVDFGAVHALAGVDLTLHRGEVLGLIGPNGAGKSTFVDAITGFLPQHSGTVTLDGVALDGFAPHRIARAGLRRTFQQDRVPSAMTVGQYARFVTRGASAQQIDDVLDYLGCPPASTPLSLVSVGTRRLIEVAAGIAAAPEVLLLDEPAAGLSHDEHVAFADRLRNVPERYDVALIVIEHDLDLVRSACSRLTVLNFGEVLASGPTADVLADPQVITAYMGETELL